MRPRSGARRRVPYVPLLAAATAGLGVLGVLLVAWSAGWLTRDPPVPTLEVPAGMVAVPAAAISIPVYTRVRLEHLADARTGTLRAVHLPEGSILPDTIVDPREIVGRVLASPKAAGHVFSTSDFFPPGTREGIVAGIPQGKRAMRIDARKVDGIVGLGHGDRFDLVATFDLERGGKGGVSVESARVTGLGSTARVTAIVEDGAVVQPLESRALPTSGSAAQVVQEMVIAVSPDEVARLAEALHGGARIDCVPRSGRPASAHGSPESQAAAAGRAPRLSVIETISGSERGAVAVPAARSAEGG